MNYLMLSVGRRGELMKDFRKSIESNSKIIATDNSPYAPALYYADKQYIVPKINDSSYLDIVLNICKQESINAVTTFIDPEIMLLSENRELFESLGIEVLAPFRNTARICFDKYEFYKYLESKGIKTVKTWESFQDVKNAINKNIVSFPIFVKPRTGSGSVGARSVADFETLELAFDNTPDLIAQEVMTGEGCLDLDADVYIDTISHQPVSIFLKRKLSTTIGGANKTISFKDQRLFDAIERAVSAFEFNGPIDMDYFYKDGEYYLSEINPRFGGAYLHAYGAGVDFIKLIENNLHGNVNNRLIGQYDEGIVMMMYDSVVIKSEDTLISD